MVGAFISTSIWWTPTNRHLKNDIRYKTALILMSTAEEMNYHDGLNKPAAMIMVRIRSLLGLIPDPVVPSG
jgi:hypothetical protein